MSEKAKRILIAEDERPMSKALELKLSKAGFDVMPVYDGQSAIDALKKETFDLLILDMVMPIKDGFTVLKEIQDSKIKVNILVSSNLGQEADFNKAKSLGAKDYFVKSDTSIAQIIDYVNQALK